MYQKYESRTNDQQLVANIKKQLIIGKTTLILFFKSIKNIIKSLINLLFNMAKAR